MSDTYHVLTNPDGGWDVKKGGGKKTIKHFQIKEPAIQFGRELSIKQSVELVIHGKNGRIQKKNSYGNDPCPPKDTK